MLSFYEHYNISLFTIRYTFFVSYMKKTPLCLSTYWGGRGFEHYCSDPHGATKAPSLSDILDFDSLW